MLMEAALVVTMAGLMTHVADENAVGPEVNKQCMAMVVDQAHAHTPSLRVRKCFREDLAEDFKYAMQSGDRITFTNGITAGHAVADLDFVAFTPSLTEPLTNSVVDEPVQSCKRHDRVAAWLNYPAGELKIAWYHVAQAEFYRGSDLVRSQCVPRGTWFIAPTHDVVHMNIEHKNNTTTTVKLKASALVEITNESHTSSSDDEAGSAHFASYGALTRRRYGFVPRRIAKVRTGGGCTQSQTHSGIINTEVLARLVESRFPDIAHELRNDCKEIVVGPVDPEHPACTNTDYP